MIEIDETNLLPLKMVKVKIGAKDPMVEIDDIHYSCALC